MRYLNSEKLLVSLVPTFLNTMRFNILSSFVAVAFASQASANPLERRVTVQSFSTITSPTDGTSVVGGQSFPFQFALSNWCETGYSPFSVYVLDSKPTAASLNATQGFDDYLAFLGTYLVDNFPGESSTASLFA